MSRSRRTTTFVLEQGTIESMRKKLGQEVSIHRDRLDLAIQNKAPLPVVERNKRRVLESAGVRDAFIRAHTLSSFLAREVDRRYPDGDDMPYRLSPEFARDEHGAPICSLLIETSDGISEEILIDQVDGAALRDLLSDWLADSDPRPMRDAAQLIGEEA